MSLVIKKQKKGRGKTDIRITHYDQHKVKGHYFLTQEVLQELVRWSIFYGKSNERDAHAALGCTLREGEVANVG
jgi:hypothetical protein